MFHCLFRRNILADKFKGETVPITLLYPVPTLQLAQKKKGLLDLPFLCRIMQDIIEHKRFIIRRYLPAGRRVSNSDKLLSKFHVFLFVFGGYAQSLFLDSGDKNKDFMPFLSSYRDFTSLASKGLSKTLSSSISPI